MTVPPNAKGVSFKISRAGWPAEDVTIRLKADGEVLSAAVFPGGVRKVVWDGESVTMTEEGLGAQFVKPYSDVSLEFVPKINPSVTVEWQ